MRPPLRISEGLESWGSPVKEGSEGELATRLDTTLDSGVGLERSGAEFCRETWNKYLEYKDAQDAQILIRVHRSRKNTPSMENPEKSYVFPVPAYQKLKNGQV